MIHRVFATLLLIFFGTLNSPELHAADQTSSGILGLTAPKEPLPWFDSARNYPVYDGDIPGKRGDAIPAVTSRGRPPMEEPLDLLLSRTIYPADDQHLDVVLRFDMEPEESPEGHLEVGLLNADGELLLEDRIDPIPGGQLYFSYGFPEELQGASGTLRVAWVREGAEPVEVASDFEIAAPREVAREGRIPISIPNETGATITNFPVTVGVPFPLGALHDVAHLRLVDAGGTEIPLQAAAVATWSRFGPVKWVHCDFTVDIEGARKELFLEFGPDIHNQPGTPIPVEPEQPFPSIDAGRLRVDEEGVWFDWDNQGHFHKVLPLAALTGAFVRSVEGVDYVDWGHRWMTAEGRLFSMSPDLNIEVESQGAEKVVLRAEDYYREEGSGEEFCRFVTRYFLYRDSPLIRIFHTWIFTGDGNRDRINNMGWEFALAELAGSGILDAFGQEGTLRDAYYLRQETADRFAIFEFEEPRGSQRAPENATPARPLKEIGEGTRAPGVAAASGEDAKVFIGVRDFWQNFPRSQRVREDSLTFYEWPRYGKAAEHPVSPEEIGEVWRLWFAHEGEVLSFGLPQAITEAPIYIAESGPEPHFAYGNPDSVNAQGVAKTMEFWVYAAPASTPDQEALHVMEALQADALRAVVDPEWMTQSGAFYEINAANPELLPEAEAAFELTAKSPHRQIEHMGVYGKWIFGDVLRGPDMQEGGSSLYRTFRKAHWGWPMSWIPYVRSGDPEYLHHARAATRMMSDVAWCHYVSDEVAAHFEALPPRRMWDYKPVFRRKGWHNRNLIPWAGYWGPTARCYVDEAEWLWDAWYVTGDVRARDVALDWAEETKFEEPFSVDHEWMGRGPITSAWNRGRWVVNLQKQYLEMYQATWDPWFLCGAHALADLLLWRRVEDEYSGHFWATGPREMARYTGHPEHVDYQLTFSDDWTDWHQQGWANIPSTLIPAAVYAWRETGDEKYLRRVAGLVDFARWGIHEGGEPDYYDGFYAPGTSNGHMLYASWVQKWMPLALAALQEAEEIPPPIPMAFDQTVQGARIAVQKSEGEALALRVGGTVRVIGPGGEDVLSGEDSEMVLEADLPSGIYWIESDARTLRLPISPPGTPEVFLPDAESGMGPGTLFAQHWFLVPEGTESFQVEIENPPIRGHDLRRFSIWDADGNEVWTHRELANAHDPEKKTVVAELEVLPDQAGRLWRITLPGNAPSFRFDDSVPTILAHDPSRWFDPGIEE